MHILLLVLSFIQVFAIGIDVSEVSNNEKKSLGWFVVRTLFNIGYVILFLYLALNWAHK